MSSKQRYCEEEQTQTDMGTGESERWDKNIEREHEGDTCEAHYEGYENDGYTNESLLGKAQCSEPVPFLAHAAALTQLAW